MEYDQHKVPRPLRDEDKWLKLTKRQLLIVLICVMVTIGLVSLTASLHIWPLGVALSILFDIAGGGIILFEIPPEKYLFGSSTKLEILLYRIIRKKMPWNQEVYTPNFDEAEEQ